MTKKKVWADLKPGDEALIVDAITERRVLCPTKVRSIGHRWITTESGYRFDIGTGRAKDFSYQLHTKKTLAEVTERRSLTQRLQQQLYNLRLVDLAILREFVETLEKTE